MGAERLCSRHNCASTWDLRTARALIYNDYKRDRLCRVCRKRMKHQDEATIFGHLMQRGLAPAHMLPIGFEVGLDHGREDVEADQVREGHHEDERVGEVEDCA